MEFARVHVFAAALCRFGDRERKRGGSGGTVVCVSWRGCWGCLVLSTICLCVSGRLPTGGGSPRDRARGPPPAVPLKRTIAGVHAVAARPRGGMHGPAKPVSDVDFRPFSKVPLCTRGPLFAVNRMHPRTGPFEWDHRGRLLGSTPG